MKKFMKVFGMLTVFLMPVFFYLACDKTNGKSIPTGPSAVSGSGSGSGGGTTSHLTVTSIVGSAGGTPSEIDIWHTTNDCNGDGDTTDPEPGLFDDEAVVTIKNTGSKAVSITDYTIQYTSKDDQARTLRSYTATIAAEIPANNSSASLNVTVIKTSRKNEYVTNYGHSGQDTFDALYTFTGKNSDGESVSVSGSLEIKLADYYMC